MRHKSRTFIETCLATSVLLVGITACESTTPSDVAYEDAYAGDYYYPGDVAVATAYGVGWGYGLYYAPSPDGGTGGGGKGGAALPGGTSVRAAVGEAIRLAADGEDVCGANATFTRSTGAQGACGIQTKGYTLSFSSCALSGGGTVDGTIAVQLNITAGDTNCTSNTTLSVGYTSTITNLTYTGTGGAKIVIPSQMDTATIQTTLGTPPGTIGMMSTGEIQHVDSNGNISSDISYSGNRTFSSISFPNETYTVDGSLTFMDKAGGTGTVAATGLMRDRNCCKPVGGMLSVNRMGGSHSGSHTWTFSATCGSATLDGKTVTLPACL